MSARQAINPYLLAFGLALAALLQASLLPALSLDGVTPNLLLVLVVCWAVLQGTRLAAPWAVVGGLSLDLLSSSPFGLHTLSLLAAAYLGGVGGQAVNRNNPLLPLVMVLAGTILTTVIQVVWLLLIGYALPDLATLSRIVLLELLLNGAVLALSYPFLAWLNRATGMKRLPLE